MREHKRSGLIETKGLSKTIRDYGGRLLETMRDYGRLWETMRDYEIPQETDRDCKRLSETMRDYGRL